MIIDPLSVPRVVAGSVLDRFAERLGKTASGVRESMDRVYGQWQGLGLVFVVWGVDVVGLMDFPNRRAQEFFDVLMRASGLFRERVGLFESFETRREILADRVAVLNRRYVEQEDASEEGSGVVGWVEDRINEGFLEWNADELRGDIRRFLDDVVAAEDELGAALAGIGSVGGFPAFPKTGAAAGVRGSFADRFQEALSPAVVDRLNMLAGSTPEQIRDFLRKHPGFVQAVGLIDPQQAARLWEGLSNNSVAVYNNAGEITGWKAGPLATLLLVAPQVIGNLNGIPAQQKDLFNRAYLARALRDPTLGKETKTQLRQVQSAADKGGLVLSLFLDGDGEPRASVAYGDVDTADQVTYLTHGINTNLSNLGDWAGTAKGLYKQVLGAPSAEGVSVAVVAWFGWDSGDTLTVLGMLRPDSGAIRLTADASGVSSLNPDAQINVAAHSLGTTMVAQAATKSEGVFDNLFFFGSAGIDQSTADQLETEIDQGEYRVSSTEAEADRVAGLGRLPVVSGHQVDPRTIDGVDRFGSDGGIVDGVEGTATGGHQSHKNSTGPGYFTPKTQSYLTLKSELIDLAAETRPRP